jgi:hypothetical protein
MQLKNTRDNFHIEESKTNMFNTILQQYAKVGHIQVSLPSAECVRGIKHSNGTTQSICWYSKNWHPLCMRVWQTL